MGQVVGRGAARCSPRGPDNACLAYENCEAWCKAVAVLRARRVFGGASASSVLGTHMGSMQSLQQRSPCAHA